MRFGSSLRGPLWGVALALVLGLGSARVLGAEAPALPFARADLDPTCAPCTDFAQFAFGGWIAKHPIPAKSPWWGHTAEMREENSRRLRALLEAAARAPRDARARQVGDLYAACTDTAALDRLGTAPLQAELERAGAARDPAALVPELAHLADIGVAPFFSLGSEPNPDGIDKPEILDLSQPRLTLPDRSYYLEAGRAPVREKYVAFATAMFGAAGEAPERAVADAQAVLRLETALARAERGPAELRDPVANTNVMPRPAAARLLTGVDFDGYLAARGIPNDVPVDVGQPPYVTALGGILAASSADDIVALLRWRLLVGFSDALGTPVDDERQRFFGGVLSGTTEKPPRWQHCTNIALGNLGDSVGVLYNARYFRAEAKGRAVALIGNVRAVFRDDLATVDWMSPATRAAAMRKLDAMQAKVGYPDRSRDYTAMRIVRGGYLADEIEARRFAVRFNLSHLNRPTDRGLWNAPSPTVNAFYSPSRNDITFLAGILQPPAFSASYDDAVNYGAMGAVMGHEMTHGFDDSGRHFDANGALTDWWTRDDAARFDARATCVAEQFDAFEVGDGVHANGRLELGEAIADLGGLAIAYRAFERAQAGKPRRTIDGFTPEQRFFLAFATYHTEADRLEFAKQRATGEPHPLGRFRVNGTVANMPEFAAAFFCRLTDPMVRPPAQRCRIW